MAFDGLFTRAMTEELARALAGGRINKIHQPDKYEIVMVVRAGGKNRKLLLSAHPSFARMQLTEEGFDNPAEPPMFCMLLRKHLEGGIIQKIEQSGLDRIVRLEVKGRNELGDVSIKELVIEIMGRHSNIVLVDRTAGTIIDSVKHVPHAMNSYRTILPGAAYVSPPPQDKLDPLAASEEDILRALDFNAGKLDKQLVSHFSGLSPLAAKEIVFQAGLANRATLPAAFLSFTEKIKQHEYDPVMIEKDGKEYFYLFPLPHLQGSLKHYGSLSELLDRFYYGKAVRDRVKQQANDLERWIKNEIEKNETKIGKLEDTLADAENADKFQLLGELLTANMHTLKKGMEEVSVLNYYDEDGGTATILLDPRKTPAENAQSYFSKYQKAKTALIRVKEQIELAETEIAYLDGLLQQLHSASTGDIEEIRQELAEEGYIKLRQSRGRKNQPAKPKLETYWAPDGTEILVGKNNKQNDYLTMKLARRDEIWLHTKDIPGSHVVIRSQEPAEGTIRAAANLAAYFSKAKNSASVPVDFTKVRHVKKPNGSKPGFVIYDQQQTVYVTPEEDVVLKLRRKPDM